MSRGTAIEWTEATWNPVTGCTKISAGCAHCYAERMARRLRAMGHPSYTNGFCVTLHEHLLDLPLGWKKAQMIFVNSMSDLFHPEVPDEFIHKVVAVMREARWHTFQVLTKRAARLAALDREISWPHNVWVGVTVEHSDCAHRVDALRATSARVKFLSLEPLLGPLRALDASGMDWVIVGGESGPGARPLQEEWVLDIRDRCQAMGVPFFFKQWGGFRKRATGRLLQGRTWDEMPIHIVGM